MADVGPFLAGMILFIAALVVLGMLANGWESLERRDARRRNRR